jgi:hypothetical protein
VKASNDAPEDVVQAAHVRVNLPRLMPDGTPVVSPVFGSQSSVALTPLELVKVVRPLPNSEPFVLNAIVSGLALTLAAITKSATPVVKAA